MKRIIQTTEAPAAIGPYSQAVLAGNTLYCSGQIPLDPSTGEMNTGSIQDQTHQVLNNLKAVLTAAGMGMEDVVKVSIFLKDLNDYAAVNEVYASYFTSNPPAREAVEVARLPKDARIEISLIAVK